MSHPKNVAFFHLGARRTPAVFYSELKTPRSLKDSGQKKGSNTFVLQLFSMSSECADVAPVLPPKRVCHDTGNNPQQ